MMFCDVYSHKVLFPINKNLCINNLELPSVAFNIFCAYMGGFGKNTFR